jgi:hypothetical protein
VEAGAFDKHSIHVLVINTGMINSDTMQKHFDRTMFDEYDTAFDARLYSFNVLPSFINLNKFMRLINNHPRTSGGNGVKSRVIFIKHRSIKMLVPTLSIKAGTIDFLNSESARVHFKEQYSKVLKLHIVESKKLRLYSFNVLPSFINLNKFMRLINNHPRTSGGNGVKMVLLSLKKR